MRIEDKIKDAHVEPPKHHQAVLRTRLLAHMKETTMKPKKHRRWLVAAVSVLTLAGLLVGANLLQPRADQTPNIAQQTLAPLTVKQVFAAALKVAEKDSQLRPGQVYYQRVWRALYTGYCHPYIEIWEVYTNANGTLLKDVFSNTDGKIIESMKYTSDGKPTDEHFFDHSALDPSAREGVGPDECKPMGVVSDADQKAYFQHLASIATAYGLPATSRIDGYEKPTRPPYLDDLRSGNVKKQAEVFKKLESTNEWKVRQNVSVPKYFKQKVTVLSFDAGPYISEKIYFSQKTKAYLGMSWVDPLSGPDEMADIVVEQGARPARDAE